MEVSINRKFIIVVVTLAIAIVAAIAVALWPASAFVSPLENGSVGTRSLITHSVTPQPHSSNEPDAATVAFAKAFYAVNYNDYEAWLAGLKEVSTDEGYAVLTKSVVPAVWPEIEKAKAITPISAIRAEDVGLALEGDSKIGGPWQIRTVKVHIDAAYLWPTMESGDFTALVMLARQNEAWRFVSFVTPDQINQIEKGAQE